MFDLGRRLASLFSMVDTIGTDHCTFSLAQKQQGAYTQDIPMGVGGIECAFKLMYDRFGLAAVDKFTVNPARAHGLYPRKGTLRPGADADIVIFDDRSPSPVDGRHSACDYSVYEGMQAAGTVAAVFLRGQAAVRDGEWMQTQGTYVPAALEPGV